MQTINGGGVVSPRGYVAGAAACGLKKERQLDLALIYSERDCSAAALFTQNQVVAAPVILDRDTIGVNHSAIRGVVANAGNANACTGAPGLWAARQMQKNAAFALGCREDQLFVLSTGVIGVQLPMSMVNVGIDAAAKRLSADHGAVAAEAILTTDTFAKQIAVRLPFEDGEIIIGGMAKGAGMIHPNMATMLAVITTDAAVASEDLQQLLKVAAEWSFNRISIDGDTSTNDTVILLANGASGLEIIDQQKRITFLSGLQYVCERLAHMIVRDGEGATKFVSIHVKGAASEADAHAVANTIATSPLVKTALAGNDPNWGRILAAAGRAGVLFEQSNLALSIANPNRDPLQLITNGTPTDYQEDDAAAIFGQKEIDIELNLRCGEAQATVWTCDLTHGYVAINADYRT